MKLSTQTRILITATLTSLLFSTSIAAKPRALFDGRTLNGWETSDPDNWRVENGAITAGDEKTKIPRNSFLFTKESFSDFEFRCEFKLTGDPKTGLINSGIQFRSEMAAGGHAKGYQADIGDPKWWGSIYDEHRRNKTIATSEVAKINPVLKRNDWNEYVIRCEGPRSRLWINGVKTTDYVEKKRGIPHHGRIAVQVHSGGAAKVAFRKLTIETFESPKSPLTPAQQQATFTVPDGFTVELVASEETGLPKPIKVRFDEQGRMWSMTATEYPVDANETPDLAKSLWSSGGKDRIVVFDDVLKPGPHTARTFADGMAMPMAVLPYKDGALVGQGSEILFLRDTDQDGKADKREVLVTGFGIQDSHLLPHQFTFGPGGWVYMAQGAFNRSNVRAGKNPPVKFDYCKLGRFKPDGSVFETVGAGLNNIWGLSLGREGEFFIQEANDMRYSVTPFQVGNSYPGIGSQRIKPYAPFFGNTANFLLGGTGLSGLALSDDRAGSYPDPWHQVMFVANPITRTINAVKVRPTDEGGYQMEQLPDFVQTSDKWFRPIAITFGPDGCLYIVDWYNKIISHNEVPRKHPDRDKSRGRVWRIRHESQQPRPDTNLATTSPRQLLKHLNSDSTWAMRAAWQQIVQRDEQELAPALAAIALDATQSNDTRIHALWALDGLGKATTEIANSLAQDPSRNVRREAAALRSASLTTSLADDPDGQVRAQALRTLSRNPAKNIAHILAYARPEVRAEKTGQAIPWNGKLGTPVPPGPIYDRAFERYLVRAALEECPDELAAFLASPEAANIPGENRLYATLALPPALAPEYFVRAWSGVDREPNDEELLTLLKGSNNPAVRPLVINLFSNEKNAAGIIAATLRLRDRLGNIKLDALLLAAAQKMVGNPENDEQLIDLASSFRMKELKDPILQIMQRNGLPETTFVAACNALGRVGAGDALLPIAGDAKRPSNIRQAALLAAATGDEANTPALLKTVKSWPQADVPGLLTPLTNSQKGSELILAMLGATLIEADNLTPEMLVRMRALIKDSPTMDTLWEKVADRFPAAIALNGNTEDYVATSIDLPVQFTVESWVRLAPKIDNSDGILGRPGGADFNFYESTFRMYGGPKVGDLVQATQASTPNTWTHYAVTRDAKGIARIYINGEFNAKGAKPNKMEFKNLQVGHTTPHKRGTAGELLEFRVWNRTQSAEQIRANFSRSFAGIRKIPTGLLYSFDPKKPGTLNGKAEIRALGDAPDLMDEKTALEVAGKISKYKALGSKEGDLTSGQAIFTGLCMSCHTLDGKGGAAAPPLDGSGHRDLDNLLHALVTPSAAVEPGYRAFRVETIAGQLVEGFLVKQDANGVTLRFMGGTDAFFPKKEIRQADFTERSFMIEGLLDNLPDAQVSDLFTYIRSLRETK